MADEALDRISYAADAPVVLVGGTGVVGACLSELLQAAEPSLPIAITSRDRDRASRAAATRGLLPLGVDLGGAAPIACAARAVVALVNDPQDRLFDACVASGVPYVDVTRYTPRLAAVLDRLAARPSRSPVILSSGWMGGIVPIVARALVDEAQGPATIETSILYDLEDRAGPDSVEFLDRMNVAFTRTVSGAPHEIRPLGCGGKVEIAGRWRGMLDLDTPEQFTLPRLLPVKTASTRIGFSSGLATCALYLLGRVRVFDLLSGDRWKNLRRALLHSNGKGGVARIRIDVSGPCGRLSAAITDPRGQAHLTAVSAYLALRRALGMGGPAPTGVFLPEQTEDATSALFAMRRAGVTVEITRSTGGPAGASFARG
jgi:hypothetical protein